MTLAIAVVTPEFAFAAADRRYSGGGAEPSFKAVKICSITTTDGQGLITFAGAGARMHRTPFELSQWITHVLRGFKRTLNQSLTEIATAATEQGLQKLAGGEHAFAFAGFVNGKMALQLVTSNPRLVSIPMRGKPNKVQVHGLLTAPFNVINFDIPLNKPVTLIQLGSGATLVAPRTIFDVSRQARRAGDRKASAQRWATLWAQVNRTVASREQTVSPEVVCAWTFKDGDGGQAFYAADGSREQNTFALPFVADGMPIGDIIDRVIAHVISKSDWVATVRDLNQKEILKGLPEKPNKKF